MKTGVTALLLTICCKYEWGIYNCSVLHYALINIWHSIDQVAFFNQRCTVQWFHPAVAWISTLSTPRWIQRFYCHVQMAIPWLEHQKSHVCPLEIGVHLFLSVKVSIIPWWFLNTSSQLQTFWVATWYEPHGQCKKLHTYINIKR